MKQIICILFATVFVLTSCKDASKTVEETVETTTIIDDSAIERINTTLESFVASGNIAGVEALIYERGEEVYYNAFGYADKEAEIPMDRNTIVQIFSMTKPITGTALMTLHEKGAFELDDPLSKYAPEFADMKVYAGEDEDGNAILEPVKREITIRDITRHTAGFARNANMEGLGPLVRAANAMNRENTLVEMAEKLGSTPLYFHPGEKWEYGPSVDVQAFLVERLSGVPYKQYVREHVLDPLKMTSTRYMVQDSDMEHFSAMYRRTGEGELTQVPWGDGYSNYTQEWPLTRGGSGLTANIDNYMRFARMMQNEGTFDGVTILKPETVKLMSTSHLSEDIKDEDRGFLPSKGRMGFGIDFAVRVKPPIDADENMGVVGEFYWDGAASTLFWVDPVNDLTAVMLVQLLPYDQIKLHKSFRDAVYGPFEEM